MLWSGVIVRAEMYFVLIQVSLWRGSCAVTPSCPCPSCVRFHVQRTAPRVPGPAGLTAHTRARARTRRASRRELAPSWPTTQEKVRALTVAILVPQPEEASIKLSSTACSRCVRCVTCVPLCSDSQGGGVGHCDAG